MGSDAVNLPRPEWSCFVLPFPIPFGPGPRAIRLDPLAGPGAIHQPVLVSVTQMPPVPDDGIGHAGSGEGVTPGPPPASGPVLGLDG